MNAILNDYQDVYQEDKENVDLYLNNMEKKNNSKRTLKKKKYVSLTSIDGALVDRTSQSSFEILC